MKNQKSKLSKQQDFFTGDPFLKDMCKGFSCCNSKSGGECYTKKSVKDINPDTKLFSVNRTYSFDSTRNPKETYDVTVCSGKNGKLETKTVHVSSPKNDCILEKTSLKSDKCLADKCFIKTKPIQTVD